jgi:hypothetical protein
MVQYPRGPEKPIRKRVGKHSVFIPPPITNPKNKTAIGLDVILPDGADSVATLRAEPELAEGEVCFSMELPPCQTVPYAFVPHTLKAEHDGDWKILMYCDQPFDFFLYDHPPRY